MQTNRKHALSVNNLSSYSCHLLRDTCKKKKKKISDIWSALILCDRSIFFLGVFSKKPHFRIPVSSAPGPRPLTSLKNKEESDLVDLSPRAQPEPVAGWGLRGSRERAQCLLEVLLPLGCAEKPWVPHGRGVSPTPGGFSPSSALLTLRSGGLGFHFFKVNNVQ